MIDVLFNRGNKMQQYNNENTEAVDILVKNILKAIKEIQQNTNSTQVFPSVIKAVNSNNTYTILDDSGQERNVKCSIPGLELKAGMNVWVTVPMGKVGMMFVSGVR